MRGEYRRSPLLRATGAIGQVRQIVPDDEQRKILYENALRIYGVKVDR